ncbi:hypothetical protein ABZ490_01545 [Streptomyces sp. NPDC005811]|uniref:hypothetical protein n=1 Tax=Streptomyces sp. NPDC005811 TaxID=3154565 RepID=UPI0033C2B3F4
MDGRLAVPSARVRGVDRPHARRVPATTPPLPPPTRAPPLRLTGVAPTLNRTLTLVIAPMALAIDPLAPALVSAVDAIPATVTISLMADMADIADATLPALASAIDPLTPAVGAISLGPGISAPARATAVHPAVAVVVPAVRPRTGRAVPGGIGVIGTARGAPGRGMIAVLRGEARPGIRA